MAKKKMKLDTSGLQQFFLSKGEKVALGIAGAIAVLVMLSGLVTAVSTSSAHGDLEKAAKGLAQRVATADPGEEDGPKFDPEAMKAVKTYALADPGPFVNRAVYYDPGAVGENKVTNPVVLSVAGGNKGKEPPIQMDLVRAPVFVHQVINNTDVKVLGLSAAAGAAQASPAEGAVGAVGASANLAKYLQPRRMVVVSAAFPYKEQLDLFRKALRKDTLTQLLADPTMAPKFLGLNVKRCERLPDGKFTEWIDVFSADPKDGSVIVHNPETRKLLAQAPYDKKNVAQLGAYMPVGTVCPLPELANGEYPELKLPGLKPAPATALASADGMTPPGEAPAAAPAPAGGARFPGAFPTAGSPGGEGLPQATAGPVPTVKNLALAKLEKTQKDLVERLRGRFDPFHPLGMMPPRKDTKKKTAVVGAVDPRLAAPGAEGGGPGSAGATAGMFSGFPFRTGAGVGGEGAMGSPGDMGSPSPADMGSPGGMEGGMEGGLAGAPMNYPDRALVRFLDVGLQPGKTYVYSVQVRMANPNYNKAQRVVFRALADIKELVSPWTVTPSVTVPDEAFFYVVDQLDIDPAAAGRKIGQDLAKSTADQVAIQVHQWTEDFKEAPNGDTGCGDWVIAERLLINRGEFIGRKDMRVLMPEWNVAANRWEFEPPSLVGRVSGSRRREGSNPLVDLLDFRPAPMVVDFKGGEKLFDNTVRVSDRSAVEALVLSPDGKLIAHNSREDIEPTSPRGKERLTRHYEWLTRLVDILRVTMPAQQVPGEMTPGADPSQFGGAAGMEGMGGP